MVWRLLSISEWRIGNRAVVAVTPVPPRVVAVPAAAPSGRNLKSADAVDVGALQPAPRPLDNISFADAFGRLGFLMLVVILVSIAWTLWLLAVTVDPNGAANYLMNTTKFDDGMMWLIANADPALVVVNALWLGAIALAYVWVAMRMTFLRNRIQADGPATLLMTSWCKFSVPTDIYLAPIVEENVRMCEGVLYRQCRRSNSSAYFPNVSGMCYSDRMMVIGCMYSPMHVRIRREEIERGIGTPCNPTEEGWLGCSSG